MIDELNFTAEYQGNFVILKRSDWNRIKRYLKSRGVVLLSGEKAIQRYERQSRQTGRGVTRKVTG